MADDDAEIEALERFVAENDDLVALERSIDRFNVFDALRIADIEIRHSNFLAWLLDPNETHGLGSLFLRALVMDMMRARTSTGVFLSVIDVDVANLQGAVVEREWNGVDIFITSDDPCFAIAIENKIRASEHSDQLKRYRQKVEDKYPGRPCLFVFLTRDGDVPSDETWNAYTYAQVWAAMSRCRDQNRGSLGQEVAMFLDHYLSLIENRFMVNPTLDELCKRIYRNHRQAIDLIMDRVGGSATPIVEAIESNLRAAPELWTVFNSTSKRIDLVPTAWSTLLPPIGTKPSVNPRYWVVFVIAIEKNGECKLYVEAWNTGDTALRRKVIDAMASASSKFGARARRSDSRGNGARLRSQTLTTWEPDTEPLPDLVAGAVASELSTLVGEINAATDAIRTVLL